MNLREQILKSNDSPLEEVFVKEWDCKLYVKMWSAAERFNAIKALKENSDASLPAKILVN